MIRSISVLMFSTTLILGNQQVFAGVNGTAGIASDQGLATDSAGDIPVSRIAKAERLIIAETAISDQMDPQTQAPSSPGTASEDVNKTGNKAKTTPDVKKTESEGKTAPDAKKSGTEVTTAPDTKKTGTEAKTTPDTKKPASESKATSVIKTPAPAPEVKATSEAKKSTSAVKATSVTKTPALEGKTTTEVKKTGSEAKTTPDAKTSAPVVKTAPATQPTAPAVKTAPATQPAAPVVKTAPATGVGVPSPNVSPRASGNPLHENCTSFDPGHLAIVRAGHHWAVVGNTRLLHFSHRRSARRALTVLQYYGMNQQCFVGYPRPLFRYYLANSRAPNAPRLRGEHCVAFSPALIHIRRARNGRWVLAEGRRHIFRFKYDRREASKALSILRKYTFNHACYVGHGSHAMRYILQR